MPDKKKDSSESIKTAKKKQKPLGLRKGQTSADKSGTKKGEKVQWNWGKGTGEGTVKEVHEEKVTKKIKGKQISRNGSAEEPAVLIEQENGNKVLKSASEVKAVKGKSK
ncbi:MAG: DUF2945 domain-containing protein [Verrucomicrobia bacterium]|nr:DUF2945 domain-containing protein [Verrucomicrobiota bacterium]